jgi:hypothetical protein
VISVKLIDCQNIFSKSAFFLDLRLKSCGPWNLTGVYEMLKGVALGLPQAYTRKVNAWWSLETPRNNFRCEKSLVL